MTSDVVALSVVDPLVIVSSPVAQNVAAGASVWFHVVVNGTPPFTFQWYHGDTPIPTGTKATLHLTNVSDADAGNYSVMIGNSSGSVTSDEAMLSVIDPPVIVSQPVAQNVAAGANSMFNVTVSGTPPFTFQWYDGGTPVATGTKATLRLSNVSAANAGNYTVTVQNSAVGTATSAAAALTITNAVASCRVPLCHWRAPTTDCSIKPMGTCPISPRKPPACSEIALSEPTAITVPASVSAVSVILSPGP